MFTKKELTIIKNIIENRETEYPSEPEERSKEIADIIYLLDLSIQSLGLKKDGWDVEKVQGGYVPVNSYFVIDAEICETQKEAWELIIENFNN